MTKENEPAYPADPSTHSYAGLTKREYFAAMSLHGLLAAEFSPTDAARLAVKAADKLIEELNQKTKKATD